MSIVELTDENFDQGITGDIPVLVDFTAAWCGPCRQLAPSLEELSEELAGRITIAKVDVDSNQEAPSRFGVRGIPALFIFRNGELIAEMTGVRSKSDLKRWIENAI